MIIKWKKLLLCIAIPLGIGGLSALLTSGNMNLFDEINKPPLSPPGWLFPVVWTLLYILMGVSLYMVTEKSPLKNIKPQLISFGTQLFFNFFWSIIFFNFKAFLFAFGWLILLWVSIAVNIFLFYKTDKRAGLLQLPYLLWVSFAGYLNLSIYFLN